MSKKRWTTTNEERAQLAKANSDGFFTTPSGFRVRADLPMELALILAYPPPFPGRVMSPGTIDAAPPIEGVAQLMAESSFDPVASAVEVGLVERAFTAVYGRRADEHPAEFAVFCAAFVGFAGAP